MACFKTVAVQCTWDAQKLTQSTNSNYTNVSKRVKTMNENWRTAIKRKIRADEVER
jgi:hypothetical protein